MYELIMSGAIDRHPDIIFSEIQENLGRPPAFVMDFRPFTFAICVVCNHEVAEQVSKGSKKFPYNMTKAHNPYVHLLGANSILTHEEWKSLRKRFNPGFAQQHLIAFLPCILEKTWHFLAHLDYHARTGNLFNLDELCTVTMDVDLDAQLGKTRQSEIIRIFQRVVERFAEQRLEAQSQQTTTDHTTKKKSRSILSLSLQDINELTPSALDSTCDQLKSFLSAGHDTTSILLQWVFYELSRTFRVLQAMCAELDEIFGPDPDPDIVRDQLLSHGEDVPSKMSHTSAVIKEILRLYPPAATARKAVPGAGYFVQFPDGRELCMDGLIVYNCETIIHRDQGVYGETKDNFIPERWLGDTDTIPPSAWRPFERGSRNCIGQELANIEARVILACTLRRYDFLN
ncbi:hypothetical protein OIDMADRAFT_37986 [Oidiodendron maius Zn]|uniref:Cytochrome P450 n=1 Tax=Oidiodendron maius (strain Zn) TaxID=913774 RepID=A0A0C3E443_OIDMZ|nr:hypothetical protein OIDMADRAFT_37986 [Oidiodendron maius Zn]